MTEQTRIPTNLRLLRIMEAFGTCDRPLTPTEINCHLGLPKQSIHRLCRLLVDEGYLAADMEGRRLQPGRRMLKLSSGVLQASHLHIVRHQVLKAAAEAIGETVNFTMPGDGGMHNVDRVETGQPVRIEMPVGSCAPFHCTASGKVYLAALRTRARNTILDTLQFCAPTPNTIVDRCKLVLELRAVARSGYAMDNEEFMLGMVAVAVPVVDGKGRFLAALALHGPSARLSVERAKTKIPHLIKAAKKLTKKLSI